MLFLPPLFFFLSSPFLFTPPLLLFHFSLGVVPSPCSLSAFFLIVLDSFFFLFFFLSSPRFFPLSSPFSLLPRDTVPRETTRAGDRYGTCRFVYTTSLSFFPLSLSPSPPFFRRAYSREVRRPPFLSSASSYYPSSRELCVPCLGLPWILSSDASNWTRNFFSFFFSFFPRSFEKLKARCSLINAYSLPRKDLRLDSILRRIDSKQLEVRQLFSPRLCPPFTNPGLDCDGFIRLDVINLLRVQRDLSSARRK